MTISTCRLCSKTLGTSCVAGGFCSQHCANMVENSFIPDHPPSLPISTLPYRIVLKVQNLVQSPSVQAELQMDFDAPEYWSPSFCGLQFGSLQIPANTSYESQTYDLDARRFVITFRDDYANIWCNIRPATVADLLAAIPPRFTVSSTRTADANTHAALRAILPNAKHELIEEKT